VTILSAKFIKHGYVTDNVCEEWNISKINGRIGMILAQFLTPGIQQ
jgi:hypothetical protein